MSNEELNAEIAVIGGTGLYQLEGMQEVVRRKLETRWGEPSSEIIVSSNDNRQVAFLARHGLQHNIPPHMVNYRANLWALKELGVKKIIAVAAVGGITDRMAPQAIVVPDQIIDYTYGRKQTYFEEELEQVTHIDFTAPYTETLRQQLITSAANQSIKIESQATYAATQGPRLETAAEIQKLNRDGADIVGMTGMPEAALARELGIDYACCALVVNWGAGCAGTKEILLDDMQLIIDKGMVQIKSILLDCIEKI